MTTKYIPVVISRNTPSTEKPNVWKLTTYEDTYESAFEKATRIANSNNIVGLSTDWYATVEEINVD